MEFTRIPPANIPNISFTFCSKKCQTHHLCPTKQIYFLSHIGKNWRWNAVEGRGFCIGARHLWNLMEPFFDNIICVWLIWWSRQGPLLSRKTRMHSPKKAESWPIVGNLLPLFILQMGTPLQRRFQVNFHSFFYQLHTSILSHLFYQWNSHF